MKKKLVITILLVLIPVAIISVIFNILTQKGIDINITNQTNREITGLYVTYNEIKSELRIPSLRPGEKYKLNVSDEKNSNENFSEGALLLEYKDKNGDVQTEYIAGYIQIGFSGYASIKIIDMDKTGKLKMKIKDNTY
ncbi:hypothetical protein AB9M62_00265 [Bacillales bacterium AN1005]|uniref:hypothetical protein n=1 Tax=Niallia taxi TaxID=2499688 RepID=UPI003008E6A7